MLDIFEVIFDSKEDKITFVKFLCHIHLLIRDIRISFNSGVFFTVRVLGEIKMYGMYTCMYVCVSGCACVYVCMCVCGCVERGRIIIKLLQNVLNKYLP